MPRHRLDPVSLLAGLAFCWLGVVFLRGTDVTAWPWHVVAPLALAFAGLLVALSLLVRPARRRGRR
jgi:hypothetical protein